MDVAEQALSALEMLSKRHSKNILQHVSDLMHFLNSQKYVCKGIPDLFSSLILDKDTD